MRRMKQAVRVCLLSLATVLTAAVLLLLLPLLALIVIVELPQRGLKAVWKWSNE